MSEQLIYKSIAGVMAEKLYIKRGSAGQGTGVLYDEVIAVLAPALIKHNIIVLPSLVSDGERETKKGAYIYEAKYEIKYVCTTDGSSVSIISSAHAQDGGDKAPGKTATYATKTAHVKVFGFETGINDESRAEVSSVESVSSEQYAKAYHLMHLDGQLTLKAVKVLKAINVPALSEDLCLIKYNKILSYYEGH